MVLDPYTYLRWTPISIIVYYIYGRGPLYVRIYYSLPISMVLDPLDPRHPGTMRPSGPWDLDPYVRIYIYIYTYNFLFVLFFVRSCFDRLER